MSRVRILNLPRNCTEDQLRQHLIKSLPPNSPHIEITDCALIKKPATFFPGKKGTRKGTGGWPSTAQASGSDIIRMAFVGFRNAASGHFVVRLLDGTYFNDAKLRVHIAKGLADVGVTTNMRKKRELQAEQQRCTISDSNSEGGKRPREESAPGESKGSCDNAGEGEEELKKKKRREEFITERLHAKSGPTWAAEVLVPQESTAAVVPTNLVSSDEDQHVVVQKQLREEGVEDAKLEEQRALERQRKLGEVSDMDFLSSLAKEADIAPAQKGNSEAKESLPNKKEDNVAEQLHVSSHNPPTDGGENQEEIARESHRVRIGNIPFIASEEDVKQFASSHVGPVEAVHIPLTRDTRQSKGAAFVKFVRGDDAVRALSLCRGAIFMGRLLRVSAAVEDPYGKKSSGLTTARAGDSEFKQKKARARCREGEDPSGAAPLAWSSTYMSSHTAVETVAKRLGVASNAVVSVEARGAAVRAAIAEAYLTSEIKEVLGDEDIDFGLLESARDNLLKARSNTTILVKNITLADSEDAAQLSKMFLRYGTLEATAFPSVGAFALFRYVHQQDARVAFQRLSYKPFKNVPLFLEWAPIGSISTKEDRGACGETGDGNTKECVRSADAKDDGENDGIAAVTRVFTLFITNIPFCSTKEDFNTYLLDLCPRLAKNPDKHIERLDYEQEKGRAFLTLRDASTMNYVQQRLNGGNFAKRTLSCVISKQTAATLQAPLLTKRAIVPDEGEAVNAGEDVAKISSVIARRGTTQNPLDRNKIDSDMPSGCNGLKLVVKNVPFEATERDIRDLFSAVSEVRSVRLPRKNNQFSSHRENNHRGFAFVEFLTEEEARRAKQTLGSTHLYGRHLVLQYAQLDDS
uniref:Putative RNA-binding protein n=1 Tax=Trypanosoma congolense (strain IL3000) TaxID=1068625 RepID=G0US06_TRYCI|nr:putative RNA-binding protein [Trypanosoma congolense IL3000]